MVKLESGFNWVQFTKQYEAYNDLSPPKTSPISIEQNITVVTKHRIVLEVWFPNTLTNMYCREIENHAYFVGEKAGIRFGDSGINIKYNTTVYLVAKRLLQNAFTESLIKWWSPLKSNREKRFLSPKTLLLIIGPRIPAFQPDPDSFP
jgi:hypothetical protein